MAPQLILEPRRIEGETIELAARLEQGSDRYRLWWKLPAAHAESITDWADPFVIGFLFLMMQRGGNVRVEGRVSQSLLRNLETYMAIWQSWAPGKYRPVRIEGDEEVEPPPATSDAMIMPFSSGIDSCFTLYRHCRGLAGRRTRKIGAAAVMYGFDIIPGQLNAEPMYAEVQRRVMAMSESLHVKCIPMSTNFRTLPTYWEHSHPTQLVSGLSLLGSQFSGMLLPNSVAYTQLEILYGSHPISDPFLGSAAFPVIDDGAESSRLDKCAVIAAWPEAMQHLRVCFGAKGNLENCCVCEKCLRSILSFRIVGVPKPPAFAHDVTDDQIRRVRLDHDLNLGFWIAFLRGFEKYNVPDAPWVRRIRATIRRAQRRRRTTALKAPFIPLRNGIRKLFRGSSLSKSQKSQMKADERTPWPQAADAPSLDDPSNR